MADGNRRDQARYDVPDVSDVSDDFEVSDVSVALSALADRARPRADLVDRAQGRAGQLRRRRTAAVLVGGTAAVTVLAVLAVSAGASVLADDDPTTVETVATQPASPAPLPTVSVGPWNTAPWAAVNPWLYVDRDDFTSSPWMDTCPTAAADGTLWTNASVDPEGTDLAADLEQLDPAAKAVAESSARAPDGRLQLIARMTLTDVPAEPTDNEAMALNEVEVVRDLLFTPVVLEYSTLTPTVETVEQLPTGSVLVTTIGYPAVLLYRTDGTELSVNLNVNVDREDALVERAVALARAYDAAFPPVLHAVPDPAPKLSEGCPTPMPTTMQPPQPVVPPTS